MMLCNFTQGVNIVSSVAVLPTSPDQRSPEFEDEDEGLNSTAPAHAYLPSAPPSLSIPPEPPWRSPRTPSPPPEGWRGSLRTRGTLSLESLVAGNWHNSVPVNGLRLDYAGLISFYNPKYTSLLTARRSLASRTQHRLRNITAHDAHLFQEELLDVLSGTRRRSGVDWGQLIAHIVERHQQRLEFLEYLVNAENLAGTGAVNSSQTVRNVRQHVFTMLAPYLSRSSLPHPDDSSPATNASWLSPAIHLCKSTYTSQITHDSCSPQELVLKHSIETTMGQICRTLGLIWVRAYDAESLPNEEGRWALLELWKAEIRRLRNWLGWAIWIKCEPSCSESELCTLPQWPWDIRTGEEEDMTPKCVSRLRWETNFPGRRRPEEPERPSTERPLFGEGKR
ncbi:hypothetical protein CALVIDRAFT_537611 [Calocera viscosa TUFC12733]|uniref:Uncharacterized protein n=1 Tax=Calocera viscosa (strain TUFC12733) TaxID=1330018 RepID=A0A167LTV3_CALVF|nr:hypothetical protein CALVIDRAFT_537611 [Calocera viscosa TUFC12733]